MADVFVLPTVGDTMVEGVVVEWFVAVGDRVEVDQVICSVETDKSVVELTSPYRGTVLRLGAAAGEVVSVGAPLVVVGEPTEMLSQFAEVGPEPATSPSPATSPGPGVASATADDPKPVANLANPVTNRAKPVANPANPTGHDPVANPASHVPKRAVTLSPSSASDVADPTEHIPKPIANPTGHDPVANPTDPKSVANPAVETTELENRAAKGLLVSPVVRRLAAGHAVSLSELTGSGPGGRIMRADVEAVIGEQQVSADAPEDAPDTDPKTQVLAMPKIRREARQRGIKLSDVEGTGPGGSITLADLRRTVDRRERLSTTRRAISAHLSESVQKIPQFTAMVEINAAGLLETRAALADRLAEPVPLDAVFVALLIPVLRDHPIMNAATDGDDVVYFGRFDIGVAIDTPTGLRVPVVRDADARSAAELAREISRLAAAARDRSIAAADLTRATCTVNNVGAVGIQAGTPILPIGTSTILALGQARQVVVLRNGNPVEATNLTISATFDHRIVDGGDAGRFLTQLREHLEVPAIGLI